MYKLNYTQYSELSIFIFYTFLPMYISRITNMNVLYPGAWTDASSVAAPGVAVQAGSELTASMQVPIFFVFLQGCLFTRI